jgi:hypothetical protein
VVAAVAQVSSLISTDVLEARVEQHMALHDPHKECLHCAKNVATSETAGNIWYIVRLRFQVGEDVAESVLRYVIKYAAKTTSDPVWRERVVDPECMLVRLDATP